MLNAAAALTAQPPAADAAGAPGTADGQFNAAMAAAATPAAKAATPETEAGEGAPDAAALALLAGLFAPLQQEPTVPAVPTGGETIDADALLAGAGAGAGAGAAALPAATPPSARPGAAAAGQPSRMPDPLMLAMAGQGEAPHGDAGAGEQADSPLSLLSRMLGAAGEGASAADGAADGTPSFTHALQGLARDVASITASPAPAGQELVRTPVGAPRWADEVGSKVMLMSLRGQQEGSLTLSPEHLGPMEVHISVGEDSTNVWFGAQHAETRAALAEAMPRLRELFAASGLALGQAGVSQDMPRQDARGAGAGPSPGALPGGEDADAPVAIAARPLRSALLDAWA